ncbi:ammonium transporter [Tichowtungia aerotolerans]|uniref:Ammonium transporter n=1 Tax=Tichowtungia aerotolerans TaxID=2697043 RepID=A0A6P1MDT1_9BACT|nr:ammonium transporter [Tichowtungia aerotolerans]QHI69255.1 ammonium transporter [Tichowtungia aerotolerans]
MKKITRLLGVLAMLACMAVPVHAEEVTADAVSAESGYAIDNLFLFIGAVLVIFMQPGFAMVESGFNAAKNAVNILFKNVMDLCIGVILYFLFGYGIMYGDPVLGGFMGWGGMGIGGIGSDVAAGSLTPQCDFLFQVAFAATAATIVSGAVAGRLKFSAYLIYSAVLTGLVYPISGFWKWGGGWLDAMGFYDFAGSLVVHSVGGFAGLAGAIVLGPRIGKFGANGKAKGMPGHNLPLAALGVFILWVGWYGFNPGSQLAIVGAANTDAVMLIAVNTTLAAAAGGILAMLTTWFIHKKPDLTMALNGILAGLVGITANCDSVTNVEAIVVGVVAGVLVTLGVKMLDALKIDDPVGAFPVHGLCGVWGGLATWIFGGHPMIAQIIGSVVIPVWAFVCMFVLFSILKKLNALRVSPEEEMRGLDIGEHGEEAYSGFQLWTVQ